jgi:two-component system response regulator FixJ
MTPDLTIFVIDDDDAVRDSLKMLLLTEYAEVRDFSSGPDFLAEVDPSSRGCLILDVNLPEMNGFELMKRMAAGGYQLPTIMVTGHGDPALRARARNLGAVALLPSSMPPFPLRLTRPRPNCVHVATGSSPVSRRASRP